MKYILITTVYSLLLGCSSIKKNYYNQASDLSSRILELKQTAIMDTVTVIINGKILDLCNRGQPIPAAIHLSNSANEYTLQADKEGEFSFNHIHSGKYKIFATYFANNSLEGTLNLNSGEVWKMTIVLGCEM